MHHARRFSPRFRLVALPIALALVLAGFALQGCENSVAEAGPVSLQTQEALDILPGTAQMVGMMDLRAARESGALETLTGDQLTPFGAGGSQDLDEFVRMTGFDPGRDIERVYVAGTSQNDHGPGAMVVYARFDRDRIERYLADEGPDEMTRTEVEGVPVYVGREGGHAFALALVNDGMAVAGEETEVLAMLDRIRTGTRGLSANTDVTSLIEQARHREGAWFAARGLAGIDGPPADDPMAQAASLTDETVVSFGFSRDGIAVDAFAAPRAGANVGDVADLVRGGVSAMRMTAKSEPALMDALDAVNVDEDGSGVRVSAFLSDALLAEMRDDS